MLLQCSCELAISIAFAVLAAAYVQVATVQLQQQQRPPRQQHRQLSLPAVPATDAMSPLKAVLSSNFNDTAAGTVTVHSVAC